MNEKDYTRGNRAAWLSMLQECLSHLDINDPRRQKVKWISEREQTISMLRRICKEYGNNNWSDQLYIPDIIEKHLERYLCGSIEDLHTLRQAVKKAGVKDEAVVSALTASEWVDDHYQRDQEND